MEASSPPLDLHFVVPGRLDTPTGGYHYDKRIVEGLRAGGDRVTVHELSGRYPFPDASERRTAAAILGGLPDGAVVVVDGLAGGALPDVLTEHASRLRLVALVHHLLYQETGISDCDKDRLFSSEIRALRAVRHIVVTSPMTARALHAELGIPQAKLSAVPPGTDPKPVAEGAGDEGVVSMLCVASQIPRKGHLDLFRALEGIRDTNWRLVCVGSDTVMPDYAMRVKEAYRRHPHKARIGLFGAVGPAELDRFYSAADLFVLPSHFEGFGMVLTEAVMRGLPIVSTTGGAIPETLPEGAGVLVPPGDAAALRTVIGDLLANPEGRRRLREAALTARETLPGWPEAVSAFRKALVDFAA
jgi:glycosyltransferase involved in cell wall biosynthesis